VLDPGATPVARPLEFIVAVAGVPDVHVTDEVTVAVVPSLYVAVALNCCVAPTAMLELAGDTAID